MTQDQMSLTVFNPLKAVNADIIAKDDAQEFDHTTDEGEKALRSWVHRMRGHCGDIDRCRLAGKADAAKFIKDVNGIAKDLEVEIRDRIQIRMKPLDEIEAKKRAEAEAAIEAERVEKEKAESERLADLKKREEAVAIAQKDIKDREDAANAAHAKIEQAKREKQIAKDAAEKAKAKAEKDKVDAAAKAEQDKQDAIAKVKQDAQDEADKVERMRLEALGYARKVKEIAEKAEAKRIANKKHRDQIERSIYEELLHVIDVTSDTGEVALAVMESLRDGVIPNVTIKY